MKASDVNDYLKVQQARIESLFDSIAHGDDEHKAWLKKAINDHFAGRPVERPRGHGTADRLAAACRALRKALPFIREYGMAGDYRAALDALKEKK